MPERTCPPKRFRSCQTTLAVHVIAPSPCNNDTAADQQYDCFVQLARVLAKHPGLDPSRKLLCETLLIAVRAADRRPPKKRTVAPAAAASSAEP